VLLLLVFPRLEAVYLFQISCLTDVFVSTTENIYVVTELLHTDLFTLLNARRLGKETVQYFMYQIMVLLCQLCYMLAS
jgi:hypothetical protein